MYKMKRRCCLEPNMNETDSLPEHLVKTVLDQAHLSPIPLTSRPIIWSHDQALWLFPSPHVVVLADEVGAYTCKYGDVVGLNPGSFSSSFSFIVYLPAERKAQQCSLESERAPANSEEEAEKISASDSSEEEGSDVNSLLLSDPRMESEDDDVPDPEPSIYRQPESMLETQEVAGDEIGDTAKPTSDSGNGREEMKDDESNSQVVSAPSEAGYVRMKADTGDIQASREENETKDRAENSEMEVGQTVSATTEVNGTAKRPSELDAGTAKEKDDDVQMGRTGAGDENSATIGTKMEVDTGNERSSPSTGEPNGGSEGHSRGDKSPTKEASALSDKVDGTEGRSERDGQLKEGEEKERAMSDDK